MMEDSFIDEDGQTHYVNEEIERLHLENQLLKNEVSKLQEVLNQEPFLHQKLDHKPLHQIREKERKLILGLELLSVPTQVIYRSSASWNSTLWINAGENHNEELGHLIVAKNSPVVVGRSVVGVIDYVGKKQSRVRLITDTTLTPSVRAIRNIDDTVWYLAKGELRGSTLPKWRNRSNTLQGVGFNYDFPDHEGPARDLRTGEPSDKVEKFPTLQIIQPEDLLITTGMDGVFPPGLEVAKVSHVKLLKEGDYSYEIEATPCCGNLDQLSLVSILSPLGFDPTDHPSHY